MAANYSGVSNLKPPKASRKVVKVYDMETQVLLIEFPCMADFIRTFETSRNCFKRFKDYTGFGPHKFWLNRYINGKCYGRVNITIEPVF